MILSTLPSLIILVLSDIALADRILIKYPDSQQPIDEDTAPTDPPPTLEEIVLTNISGTFGVPGSQSHALIERLQTRGALSKLTSLVLSSGPEVTHALRPFYPTIGHTLQHFALYVHDVVRAGGSQDGFYLYMSGQLHVKLAELYNALLDLPHLRSLRITYDAMNTFKQAMILDPDDPRPCLAPTFLNELVRILSRDDVPFPHLEVLSLDIFATVESLRSCTDAWTALRGALAREGRYQAFARLEVTLEEMTMYGTIYAPEYNQKERTAMARALFRDFVDAGIRVEARTFESKKYHL